MKYILPILILSIATCAFADDEQYLPYDDFIRQVEAGNVESVTLDQYSSISGIMVDGGTTNSIRSYANTGSANDPLLNRFLKKHDVSVSIRDVIKASHTMPMLTGFIFIGAPIVFLVLLVVIIMKLNRILANQGSNQPPD